LELEADEFESNNNVQNETKENNSEPEKVHAIAEILHTVSFKHPSSFEVKI
jgi:hypothetical protein